MSFIGDIGGAIGKFGGGLGGALGQMGSDIGGLGPKLLEKTGVPAGMGLMDMIGSDPKKMLSGGLLGAAGGMMDDIGKNGLNLGAAFGYDTDIGSEQSKMLAEQDAGLDEPFDLKTLATDLDSISEQQRQEKEASMKALQAQLAAAPQAQVIRPQGAMPVTPPSQAAMMPQQMSGAMQTIQGGMGNAPQMQQQDIGAMMRRLRGL